MLRRPDLADDSAARSVPVVPCEAESQKAKRMGAPMQYAMNAKGHQKRRNGRKGVPTLRKGVISFALASFGEFALARFRPDADCPRRIGEHEMSEPRPEYRRMKADVIVGLARILVVALEEARSHFGKVDLDELETMVEICGVLAPGHPEASFLGGLVQAGKGNWREASDAFLALTAASQCLPRSRTMLAYALNRAGDPSWREHAEALCESEDATARTMGWSLLEVPEDERPEWRSADAKEGAGVERLADEASVPPSGKSIAAAPPWVSFRLRA